MICGNSSPAGLKRDLFATKASASSTGPIELASDVTCALTAGDSTGGTGTPDIAGFGRNATTPFCLAEQLDSTATSARRYMGWEPCCPIPDPTPFVRQYFPLPRAAATADASTALGEVP